MDRVHVLLALTLVFGQVNFCFAQSSAPQQSADSPEHRIPVIDGGAGSCSLNLTVTAEGKPVYAATIKVHIAYGFGSMRKLDLEASTNVDGKVRFTGIPAKVRRSTLEFEGTKDQLSGTLTYDPAAECQATHEMVLEKASSQPPK